jgi:hypothetical protein
MSTLDTPTGTTNECEPGVGRVCVAVVAVAAAAGAEITSNMPSTMPARAHALDERFPRVRWFALFDSVVATWLAATAAPAATPVTRHWVDEILFTSCS